MSGQAASSSGRVVGLVLAAGSSRRFGADKRQALLPGGDTLLDTVLRTQRAVLQTVLVVTPLEDDFADQACRRHQALRVPCPQAAQGMGRSLAAGLLAAQALDPSPDAVLLALADMPGLQADTLVALLSRFHATGHAVMPVYLGRPGHPRVLPRGIWPALMALSGDEGARHAVDWRQAEKVDVSDAGVLLDVDTTQDLAALG
jgi:molybdenum cofactor cytidylyltransferase